MGIAELTTLTVLVADSTELASWLIACCLAYTLPHCGARVVKCMLGGTLMKYSPDPQKTGDMNVIAQFSLIVSRRLISSVLTLFFKPFISPSFNKVG